MDQTTALAVPNEGSINTSIQLSLGLLEALEQLLQDLGNLIKISLVGEQLTTAEELLKRITNIVEIISDNADPMELGNIAKLSGWVYNSKIYTLGIAGEVIKLRESGQTISQIANLFQLSTSTINRFLKHYDSLSNMKKARLKASSVMNTTDRLEDLLSMTLRQLHRLEGVNDEIHVKYVGELRQTLGLAAQVSEKIATYKAYEQFKQTVEEILISELPERRVEIVKKLRSLKAGNEANTYLPSSLS